MRRDTGNFLTTAWDAELLRAGAVLASNVRQSGMLGWRALTVLAN